MITKTVNMATKEKQKTIKEKRKMAKRLGVG